MTIRSFRDKDTRQFFSGERIRRFQSFERQAEKRLRVLDSATSKEDLLNNPGNHFESLEGNRKGQFSIRINRQWRICFVWRSGNAEDVEIIDYH